MATNGTKTTAATGHQITDSLGRTRNHPSRFNTNGIVGRRAKQRARATGKPVDHRHSGLEREVRAAAKREAKAAEAKRRAARS